MSSIQRLMDDDGSSAWLKPSEFLEDDFCPLSYVGKLQNYVPLDTLEAELGRCEERLRDMLVEVVNEDYDEFVSLSTKLVDLDSVIPRLEAPLREIQSTIEKTRTEVSTQASTLEDGLKRRQMASSIKSSLELAQDAIHVMAKIEKLLEELPSEVGMPTSDDDHEALEGQCRLLDRLASEVGRLQFYVQKGTKLAAVQALEERNNAAAFSLQGALEKALEIVLEVQNPVAFAVLLHAYSTLGWNALAEKVVRRTIVVPVVKKAFEDAVHQYKYDKNSSESITSFSTLVSHVQIEVEEKAGPFLQLALGPSGGASAFDFLGNAVLPEIIEKSENVCVDMYSPGNPDMFFANYQASNVLLVRLEEMCQTPDQVHRLRRSTAWRNHLSKWNLPAYFSLRNHEVLGRFEDRLRVISLFSLGKGSRFEFQCEASIYCWDCVQACFSGDTYLRPLGDKFVRLSFQIIARYCTWIREYIDFGKDPSGNGNRVALVATSSQEGSEREQEASHADCRFEPEQLLIVWHDMRVMEDALDSKLKSQVLSLLDLDVNMETEAKTNQGEGFQAIQILFKDAIELLKETRGKVLKIAAEIISSRCRASLKQLRGIVATFRMTQRATPSRPAQYASDLLRPLKVFLEEQGASLPEDAQHAFTTEVVQSVTENYKDIASDTMDTVRKTESSLRRLKSRKDADSAGPPAQSTDALIAAQLMLDIQEFGRQATQCKLTNVEEMKAFQDLRSVIAP